MSRAQLKKKALLDFVLGRKSLDPTKKIKIKNRSVGFWVVLLSNDPKPYPNLIKWSTEIMGSFFGHVTLR